MLQACYLRSARGLLDHASAYSIALVDALVLVPNFQAGAELAQALVQESGLAVLLPPRIITMPVWANEVPLDVVVMPDSRRVLLLYQALRERDWFDADTLWGISVELGRLFDEITHQAITLPSDVAEFAAQLLAAYRVHSHIDVEFEAKLVYELWYVTTQLRQQSGKTELSPASLYALQLAQQVRHADRPLFTLGLSDLTRQEQWCLTQYGERHPVIPLPMHPEDDRVISLRAAWPTQRELTLRERGQQLSLQMPNSPWQHRLHITGARGMEHEARCADAQIRLWLAAGKQRIAVVVYDRLTARRLRALLERSSILVADETGWSLDTTTASSVVMRWLDAVRADFSWQDVLDLLQSRQLFLDWAEDERELASEQVEYILRNRRRPLHGLSAWKTCLAQQEGCLQARTVFERLRLARSELWSVHGRTLSAWLDALTASLTVLGAQAWLEADQAGSQLVALLAQHGRELHGVTHTISLTEFRQWLTQVLQAASFVDCSVDSPIVFTHLAATRLRCFDAALLLGADTQQLAGSLGSTWFNQSVRAALGLSTLAERTLQTERDLATLLWSTPQVRVLWQAERDGEANPLNAWFDRLDLLHQMAWGASLHDAQLSRSVQPVMPTEWHVATPPQPILVSELVPLRVSVSGYRSLMVCPYQYFTYHVLGLRPLDDIDTDVEKSDYGQLVHGILYAFHTQYPRLMQWPIEQAEQALATISRQHFSPLLREDVLAQAWQQRWLAKIPAYVVWQREREQQGWQWMAGEVTQQHEFALAHGQHVTLHGRLDRVDRNAASLAVLDYKTGALRGLQEAAQQPDEDVQLAAYALLMGSAHADAHDIQSAFVALDEATIATAALAVDSSSAAQCCGERLVKVFNQLHAGVGLPANGNETHCLRCEARGLCRRGDWT